MDWKEYHKLIEKINEIEIPQAFVEWLLDELQLGQAETASMEEQQLAQIQKHYKDANDRVNMLMKRQLDSTTAVSEDLFKSTLKELEADRDAKKQLINDFHETARQRTKDTVEAAEFAKDLRKDLRTEGVIPESPFSDVSDR